jgi:hypothetical protein
MRYIVNSPARVFYQVTLSTCLVDWAVTSSTGNSGYFDAHGWPKTVGLVLAGCLVLTIGYLRNKRPAKVFIDKESGNEITVKDSDTVFFIPMIYWGPILISLGIVYAFAK